MQCDSICVQMPISDEICYTLTVRDICIHSGRSLHLMATLYSQHHAKQGPAHTEECCAVTGQ